MNAVCLNKILQKDAGINITTEQYIITFLVLIQNITQTTLWEDAGNWLRTRSMAPQESMSLGQ